jgi:hypothetical protein
VFHPSPDQVVDIDRYTDADALDRLPPRVTSGNDAICLPERARSPSIRSRVDLTRRKVPIPRRIRFHRWAIGGL